MKRLLIPPHLRCCAHCNSIIPKERTWTDQARYCSIKCKHAAHYQKARNRPKPKYRPPLGGRSLTQAGYVVWTFSDQRIYEHRILMEQHIGRELSPDEVVHHRNGITSDNRIENLELLSRAEHSTLHFPGAFWLLAHCRWSKLHR